MGKSDQARSRWSDDIYCGGVDSTGLTKTQIDTLVPFCEYAKRDYRAILLLPGHIVLIIKICIASFCQVRLNVPLLFQDSD